MATEFEKQYSATGAQTMALDSHESAELMFGKLLSFLREEKQTQFLVLCRKIDEVSLTDNVLELGIKDVKILQELSSGDFELQIQGFLKQNGLSLKFKDEVKPDDDKVKLRQLIGSKLQII